MKSAKQMERHFKGMSNHNRINILLYVSKQNEATLEQISSNIKTNFKNISQHTHRLVNAGLLNKKYQGLNVLHSLSPYGREIVNFIKKFKKL
ncbi:hypothetical protein COV42_00720 [Candidatus Campbellbacteria bacterium CG11_big_fil_rev_8_21_14_0_20_44_21]|uniref:HTH arsR-type domain-containing protein n=1 Tax=Candidatus Campbellbacteria bacterium CG22_combo_CG10-13_8_21_14_all_43_18 TaxID=1974530 RepID=A0A2H0DX38_9BACT|nr:MAG: hypothetical protein COW82_00375 [Candidatus Campbellbacteria bacterium CG22_combo_CG10-13_8_21_14_all_43_18]PIR24429.1 MAG: hypothetical protein COV42_00720 [Candidatus Campbellbacteria bacterium CG11_big_fil_rev_8_21_14_0_20_44_21]